MQNYKNIISIDIETTGLDENKDKILSVALVPLANQEDSIEVFIKYDQPLEFGTKDAETFFQKYKKQYEEKAVAAPEAIKIINDFILARSQPSILLGHNVSFDIKFLNQLYYTNKVSYPWSHRSIDTHSIVIFLEDSGYLSPGVRSLNKVLERFSIPLPQDKYHTALGDATATAELYLKLVSFLTEKTQYKQKGI